MFNFSEISINDVAIRAALWRHNQAVSFPVTIVGEIIYTNQLLRDLLQQCFVAKDRIPSDNSLEAPQSLKDNV